MQHAIRVDPGVQFQSTSVRFGHSEGQRIVKGFRRLAHRARQIFRPGFDLRCVKSITCWTHLKYDSIESHLHSAVQNSEHLDLLLPSAQTWLGRPIDVLYGRYPHPAELA